MNKNPFSFYDFLGYLFPGIIALALTVFAVALNIEKASIDEYFNINKFVAVFQEKQGLKWWESTILVIILSYVTGHIIAYMSSVVVEYFANSLFGYPSYYLLHDRKIRWKMLLKTYWVGSRILFGRILWRFIVFIILFPIAIVIGLIGIPLKMIEFIVRPLDEYIQNSIQRKLLQLSKTLNLDIPDVNSTADHHRIVMHYVYLNIPNCQRKVDNYIAIYGFLRAITLIACLFFDYLLYLQICTLDIDAYINWDAAIILLFILILCNILFMGFVKFYRRFTLENYMALLTEKDIDVE